MGEHVCVHLCICVCVCVSIVFLVSVCVGPSLGVGGDGGVFLLPRMQTCEIQEQETAGSGAVPHEKPGAVAVEVGNKHRGTG